MASVNLSLANYNTLRGDAPTTPLGDVIYWLLGNQDTVLYARALARPDWASLPAGAIVDSATLYAYCYQYGNAGTYTIRRILTANEGWNANGTWNKRDGTNNWAGSVGCSTEGTDYSATVMGSGAPTESQAAWHTYTFSDLTEFQAMFAASGSFVLFLVGGGAGTFKRYYWSPGYSNESLRPYIAVEYHMPGAAAFVQQRRRRMGAE